MDKFYKANKWQVIDAEPTTTDAEVKETTYPAGYDVIISRSDHYEAGVIEDQIGLENKSQLIKIYVGYDDNGIFLPYVRIYNKVDKTVKTYKLVEDDENLDHVSATNKKKILTSMGDEGNKDKNNDYDLPIVRAASNIDGKEIDKVICGEDDFIIVLFKDGTYERVKFNGEAFVRESI